MSTELLERNILDENKQLCSVVYLTAQGERGQWGWLTDYYGGRGVCRGWLTDCSGGEGSVGGGSLIAPGERGQ